MILSFDTPSGLPSVGSMKAGSVFEYNGHYYLRMLGADGTGLAKVVNIVTGVPAEFMFGTLVTSYVATVSLKKAV